MKQIKAFVHRNRVSDLIHALEAAGFQRLALFDVKGLLRALSAREQEYSVELGDKVINEVQMELFCEDGDVARAVEIFQRLGRTGRTDAGWVYVSNIEQTIAIGDAYKDI
ncbi:MAG: P-II family nitrogen regulator [Lysobacterales bacterium]